MLFFPLVSSLCLLVRREDEREDVHAFPKYLVHYGGKESGVFLPPPRERANDPSISVSSSARTDEGRPSFHRMGRRARMPARRLPTAYRPTDWV